MDRLTKESGIKEEVRECASCEWCQSLEDSMGRTCWFCVDADSVAFLEETGLCGYCTREVMEDEHESY